eukprot:6214638-Pleurochrysis_carterae.AAC.2
MLPSYLFESLCAMTPPERVSSSTPTLLKSDPMLSSYFCKLALQMLEHPCSHQCLLILCLVVLRCKCSSSKKIFAIRNGNRNDRKMKKTPLALCARTQHCPSN